MRALIRLGVLGLAGCCISTVPEVAQGTGGTSTGSTGATTTGAQTATVATSTAASGSGTSAGSFGTGTTGAAATGSGSSTSGGANNPCTPFDRSLCTAGQYCEYTLQPCEDGTDNVANAGQCTNVCSVDPEGSPVCGGSCQSDVDCPLDEACQVPGDTPECAGVVCPEQPTDCAPECQPLTIPHGCPTCVCPTCPLADAGLTLPDGGPCPTEDLCGSVCCDGPNDWCCNPLVSACILVGSTCPI